MDRILLTILPTKAMLPIVLPEQEKLSANVKARLNYIRQSMANPEDKGFEPTLVRNHQTYCEYTTSNCGYPEKYPLQSENNS